VKPARSARRLFTESGTGRGYLAGCLVLGLTVTGLILAQAGLLARALAVTGPLGGTLTALLAVVIARAAASQGAEVTALRAAASIKERLRSRLLTHTLARGPRWLQQQRSGEISTLATTGLDSLDPYFARYLPQAVLAIAVPSAVIVGVTTADWLSGLILVITLPLVPVFAVLIGLRTKAQTRRSWQLLAKLSGHFVDVVQGLTTLKIFGRAEAQERIIEQITDEYRVSVLATLRVAFLSALVLELTAAVATALVAVEVGLRLLYGHLGYQTALFVLLLTPEAFLPVRNAAAAFHASANGTAAAERVFEILDSGPAPASTGSHPVPDLRSAAITLHDVTVSYPGRQSPALHHVNLTVNPGDRVTLIGSNGAGKSTLLSLFLKFVDPEQGRVSVGATELADIPAEAWRRQLAWLPQHPVLFPWSVAANIGLGQPGVSLAAIERAAQLAGAADFIAALPAGYQTVLDERALRLSAGQRQKVALARVLLRDAPLLLLDEPAAHLDSESAASLDALLRSLSPGRTIIVVTHHASQAGASGRLLMLADGSLTELEPLATALAKPELVIGA
jgi:ATP-binding cassette, subfamily C, bacterial CydD